MRTFDNGGKIIVVLAMDMNVVIASGLVAVLIIAVVVGLEGELEDWGWDKSSRRRDN